MTMEIAMQEIAKSMENAKLTEIAKAMLDLNTNVADLDKPMVKELKENQVSDVAFCSTYAERLQQTPINNGQWLGERGESIFISENQEVNAILEPYGIEGIVYQDCIPDFSGVARAEVTIDNMTDARYDNFRQASIEAAKQRGCEPRDVANWMTDNGYTWHECNDQKTCQKIPSSVNAAFGHLGGVSEYKLAHKEGAVFDE